MENSQSYEHYLESPYRSVKHSTYFNVYDDLFSRYREKNITFVEIGILDGGSLFMWRNFFGPKARIIGVDLNPDAKKWEDKGFEIFIGSQSDEFFWKDFIRQVGVVDVVLDDGGHTYVQQIVTSDMLLDNIKDGGMLVIEDTHTSYMNGFGDKSFSFIKYVKSYIDKINKRFGDFDKVCSDSSVWSIQSYESIVAFHVNREYSRLISKPTCNEGKNDNAKDYRYLDGNTIDFIDSFFKKILGIRLLRSLSRYFTKWKSRKILRKYF